MDTTQQEHLFQTSLDSVRVGRPDEALVKLKRLIDAGSQDPRHLSLYGLLLATRAKKVKQGQELCERARLIGADRPQVYINLSRLYAGTGQRIRAVKVLREGLTLLPGHKGLMAEIQRLSPRRTPVLSSLHRDHILNRGLGRFRASVFGNGQRKRAES